MWFGLFFFNVLVVGCEVQYIYSALHARRRRPFRWYPYYRRWQAPKEAERDKSHEDYGIRPQRQSGAAGLGLIARLIHYIIMLYRNHAARSWYNSLACSMILN